MHGLTNPVGWEKAMGSGGALEAFIKARDKGLVRFLGITGHGSKVPVMHRKSLERFEFDSVLLPYNYYVMQNHRYSEGFAALLEACRERNVAVQTIKSIAWRPWGDRPRTYNTYFYEPFETQEAIDLSVQWAFGLLDSFMNTTGDMKFLPKVLDAVSRFNVRPPDTALKVMVDEYEVQPIFK
jgi:hypothetical protein